MTKTTVMIGGQEVSLRTSAYLPILYRLLFGDDFLRNMTRLNKVRTKYFRDRVKKHNPEAGEPQKEDDTEILSADESTPESALSPDGGDATTVAESDKKTVRDSGQTDEDDEGDAELLEKIDLVFVARMEYAMAYHADSSLHDSSMEEWFASLDDANAVYQLLGPALDIYSRDSRTTSVPKKKAGKRKGK